MPGPSPGDRWLPVAAGLLSFCIYVPTLAPGLYGFIDTPVFQFVGRVLGTAHSPGYPLYTLLSHVFVALPIGGTLAWRANLFSAVLASLAVALVAAGARHLGCSRAVAFASALAFGTSLTVWNSALVAEVYALQAALSALAVTSVLAWARTRRRSWLLAAVAAAGLAAANHTSIALAVPALVVFVLVVDWRSALRPSTLAAAAGLLLLSASLYLFIVWRSYAGAPYLHAHAFNLADLQWVVAGGQFSGNYGAVKGSDLVAAPRVVFERLQIELTRPGVIGMVTGLALLTWRRRPEAWLLGGIAAAFCSLPFWYPAPDWQYMVMTAWVAAWLLVAVAAEAVCAAIRARSRGLVAAGLVAALLVPVPARLFQRNLAANNLGRATHDQVFFDALFADLPHRSALVADYFVHAGMVRYKMIGEEAAGARDIRFVDGVTVEPDGSRRPHSAEFLPLWREGFDVRLFSEAATTARLEGIPLSRVVLPRSAPTYASELPPGTFVVLALPEVAGRDSVVAALVEAGLLAPGDVAGPGAVAVVRQLGRSAAVAAARGPSAAALSADLVTRHSWASPAVPAAVSVRIDATRASITLRGEPLLDARHRVLLVALHERGYLLDAQAIEPAVSPLLLGVPQPGTLALWRVAGEPRCLDVSDRFTPLAPLGAADTLVVQVDRGGELTLEGLPCDPPRALLRTMWPEVTVAPGRSCGSEGGASVHVSTGREELGDNTRMLASINWRTGSALLRPGVPATALAATGVGRVCVGHPE